MINILIQPTLKNPVVCLTYNLFEYMDLGYEYKKKETLSEAIGFIKSVKHYVLHSNIECFRRFSEQVFPPEDRDMANQDAIRIIHELTIEIIESGEKWQTKIDQILEKISFMKLLIKNAPEEHKPPMVVIVASISDFCKKELDEINKSQSEIQSGDN